MMKRRLWVASELYWPEETSTGVFLTRIAEGLADDYDVRVIAGRPTYSQHHAAVETKERRNGVTIHRVASTRFDKDTLALRAINLLSFSVSAFFFTLFNVRRGDLTLVVTNPPTLPLVIGVAAGLRCAKRILLVHDVYPDILAAAGFASSSSLLYRLLDAIFTRILPMFDRIVVLGRDMCSVIERKTKRLDHLCVIENWGDVDEVFPLPDKAATFRAVNGLAGKTIVQFSGNIGRTHDVDALLDTAEAIADDTRLHVLFVGYGGKADYVERQIRARGLKNVTFLPRQPREKLNEMLNASELTVISLTDKMLGLSVPSRMYNVMAAGAPVFAIADPASELSSTVEEKDAGWTADYGDASELTRVVRRLCDELREEAMRRGEQGRAAVLAHYRFENAIDAYRRLLAEFDSEEAS
jgi:glycosyltransferase involved in cell wall biosynthesis